MLWAPSLHLYSAGEAAGRGRSSTLFRFPRRRVSPGAWSGPRAAVPVAPQPQPSKTGRRRQRKRTRAAFWCSSANGGARESAGATAWRTSAERSDVRRQHDTLRIIAYYHTRHSVRTWLGTRQRKETGPRPRCGDTTASSVCRASSDDALMGARRGQDQVRILRTSDVQYLKLKSEYNAPNPARTSCSTAPGHAGPHDRVALRRCACTTTCKQVVLGFGFSFCTCTDERLRAHDAMRSGEQEGRLGECFSPVGLGEREGDDAPLGAEDQVPEVALGNAPARLAPHRLDHVSARYLRTPLREAAWLNPVHLNPVILSIRRMSRLMGVSPSCIRGGGGAGEAQPARRLSANLA